MSVSIEGINKIKLNRYLLVKIMQYRCYYMMLDYRKMLINNPAHYLDVSPYKGPDNIVRGGTYRNRHWILACTLWK